MNSRETNSGSVFMTAAISSRAGLLGKAYASTLSLLAPSTNMSHFTKTEAGREITLGMQALKRIGKPEDVADVVACVARWIRNLPQGFHGLQITLTVNAPSRLKR